MKTFCTRCLLLLAVLGWGWSCKTPPRAVEDDGRIAFTILQVNDVYEIAPLPGDDRGGMARLKALLDSLEAQTPNTLFVLAGDFLNPSLLGSLKFEGERIKGRHMVEVMNAAGIDLVVFGNHEFDLEVEDLQRRLDESEFEWLATNVLQRKGEALEPFRRRGKPCPESFIWNLRDADGTTLRVGFFGAVINSNEKDYVHYEDPYAEARKAYRELAAQCDLVLGLTHLEMEMDLKLASLLPEVPLIMGGHEHDLHYDSVGSVHIAKADANAKTAWVHRFEVSKRPRLSHRLRSEVVAIDGDRPEDSAVAALVERWLRIQNAEIGKIGVDPAAVIYHAAEPLDGREKSIRNEQTNLGRLIAEAMYAAAAQPVDGALYNSGSVRIDDQLVGDLTAVDVFRALPFGGGLVEVTLEGSLLKKLLDQGQENKGKGGYLQWYRIRPTPNGWLIGDQPLDPRKSYRIVTTDFLLTGLESGMGFFTPENPGIHHIDRPNSPDDPRSDIRKAVIEWMKGVGGE